MPLNRYSILHNFGFAIVNFIFLFIFSFPALAQNRSLEMVTYYPAPQGAYDRLSLTPDYMIIEEAGSCNSGSIHADYSGNLLYCDTSNPGNESWKYFNNPWVQNENNVYVNTGYQCCGSFNYKVAIGSSTPDFKLTLDNDGGILAMGEFGSGTVISDFTDADDRYGRFIWYPRRAVFRVLIDDPWDNIYTTDSALGDYSVGFGTDSIASGTASTVGGGGLGQVFSDYSTVLGGYGNGINTNSSYSTIAGGWGNNVGGYHDWINGSNYISSPYSTVAGYANAASGSKTTISGGAYNFTSADGQTIAGGYINNAVSGGFSSYIVNPSAAGSYATIAGGTNNTTYGDYAFVSGSGATANSYSTIGGGSGNKASSNIYATIAGGLTNQANADYSSVAGGDRNIINSGSWSVIGSGYQNNITSQQYSGIAGGYSNNNNGNSSVILGGRQNNITNNSAQYSIIAGGYLNSNDGSYSVVGGRNMTIAAGTTGSFLWGYAPTTTTTISSSYKFIVSDISGSATNMKFGILQTNPSAILEIKKATTEDFLAITSTSAATPGDIFIIKNNGYIGIGQPNPTNPLQFGNGAYLTAGGTFTNASSRDFKTNIQELNSATALKAVHDLNPVTFQYKVDPSQQHVGFIAEDVPDLVSERGRRSVDPMNIAAVLTSVAQGHQKDLIEENKILQDIELELKTISDKISKP